MSNEGFLPPVPTGPLRKNNEFDLFSFPANVNGEDIETFKSDWREKTGRDVSVVILPANYIGTYNYGAGSALYRTQK